MDTSQVVRLISHRDKYIRRILQSAFSIAALCFLYLASTNYSSTTARLTAGIAIILASILTLVLWEHRAILKRYRLTVFPPGYGSLRPRQQDGAGRFLSLSELATHFRWRPGSIFFGRPLKEHSFFGLFHNISVGSPVDAKTHMLTIASSGAGKGAACIIPNLLLYPGSVLVIDPKGENAHVTAARRGRPSTRVTSGRVKDHLGQDVHIFDPDFIVRRPENCCWNPLSELNLSSPDLPTRVKEICEYLIVTPPDAGQNQFFYSAARNLLSAIILHTLSIEPPDRHNLIYIRRLILQGDTELYDLLQDQLPTDDGEDNADNWRPDPHIHECHDPFTALLCFMASNEARGGYVRGIAQKILSYDPEARTGVVMFLEEQTAFLDHYGLQQTLIRSDFSLRDLKTKDTTIYICIKPTSLSGLLRPVISLLVNMAVLAMQDEPAKPSHPVLFVLDEFYSLGRSKTIETAMGLMRGYHLAIWPILQHIGQLKEHYPNTFDSFWRNCRAVQIFGDFEPDTLKAIEQRIGSTVVKTRGQEIRKPLLTTDEMSSGFFEYSARQQLVLMHQQPAALLELVDYYKLFPADWYEEVPKAQA
jgi:type IV secretion system protein VirD4